MSDTHTTEQSTETKARIGFLMEGFKAGYEARKEEELLESYTKTLKRRLKPNKRRKR